MFLWRACWHIGVANTAALQLADLHISKQLGELSFDVATKQHVVTVQGGAIDYNTLSLLPTGMLRERAVEPVVNAIAKHKTPLLQRQFIQEGLDICLRKGLTAVHTNDERSLEIYYELQREGKLPIRVLLTPNQAELTESGESLHPIPLFQCNFKDPSSAAGERYVTNASESSSRLGMHRVKIFSDGSLGAETAAMRLLPSPASDKVIPKTGDYKGILMHTIESLVEMIEASTAAGFRVEIHAIGDAAAEQVVGAVVAVNEKFTDRKISPGETFYLQRPILTHCQVLGPEIVDWMSRHGVIANIQPSFVPTDMRWVLDRMSHPQQLRYAYAWRTLLQAGIHCAGGSDAPIEDASPFLGIYDAVHRSNRHRLPPECTSEVTVFRPEESLTLIEAVAIYSEGGSYAAGYEDVWGRIAVGAVADFVFVPRQLIGNLEDLPALRPLAVMVGGHVTYYQAAEPSSLPVPSNNIIIVKEHPSSLRERDVFDAISMSFHPPTTSTQQAAIMEGSGAPFIPGKGGSFDVHGDSSQAVANRRKQHENSKKRSESSYHRKGFCRCLLHMEYCG